MSHAPEEGRADLIPAFNSRSNELSRMIQQGRSWSGHERNCAYLNLGNDFSPEDSRFANISAVSGLDFDDDARGIAVLDWDHDGDLDLWIRNRNAPQLRMMQNEAGRGAGNFLRLQLRGDGKTTNRDAIGARVEVTLRNSPLPLVRTIRAGDAFLTQSSKVLHFGLGADPETKIERVVIRWPNREGTREIFTSGFEPNHVYLVKQGEAPSPVQQRRGLKLEPLPVELPPEDSAVRVFAQSNFPLPEVSYRDSNGEAVVHQAQPGQWTLINLWATWCAPCLAELRDFATRATELEAAGIQVVALSVDLPNEFSPDSPFVKKSEDILHQLKFPFRSGFAESGLIAQLQAVNNNLTTINSDLPVPSSFLVNPRRQVVAIYKGKVSIDQVLTDAKKVDYPVSERLEKALSLGGSLVPDHAIREAEISREAAFQFYIGRALLPLSALSGVPHFSESLRLKPDFTQPRIHLGIALHQLNEMEAARQQFEQVLAQNPGNEETSSAHYQLSEIALREGRIDDAIDNLEATLQNSSEHPLALNNLAFLLASQNPVGSPGFERALTMAKRSVELTHSQQANFLDTLGGLYTKAEHYDEALSLFEKALALAGEQKNDELVAKLQRKLQDCRAKMIETRGPK